MNYLESYSKNVINIDNIPAIVLEQKLGFYYKLFINGEIKQAIRINEELCLFDDWAEFFDYGDYEDDDFFYNDWVEENEEYKALSKKPNRNKNYIKEEFYCL